MSILWLSDETEETRRTQRRRNCTIASSVAHDVVLKCFAPLKSSMLYYRVCLRRFARIGNPSGGSPMTRGFLLVSTSRCWPNEVIIGSMPPIAVIVGHDPANCCQSTLSDPDRRVLGMAEVIALMIDQPSSHAAYHQISTTDLEIQFPRCLQRLSSISPRLKQHLPRAQQRSQPHYQIRR
jgi:hypothetical protein